MTFLFITVPTLYSRFNSPLRTVFQIIDNIWPSLKVAPKVENKKKDKK